MGQQVLSMRANVIRCHGWDLRRPTTRNREFDRTGQKWRHTLRNHPIWHARKHLPLVSTDDATSLHPPSQWSFSPSTTFTFPCSIFAFTHLVAPISTIVIYNGPQLTMQFPHVVHLNPSSNAFKVKPPLYEVLHERRVSFQERAGVCCRR